MANSPPDSRTPRRLSAARTMTATLAARASLPSRKCSSGTDLAFWTPDEIDTATVRT